MLLIHAYQSYKHVSKKITNWSKRANNKMASIAVMAGGALVNALAFSGTNFIFSQFGNHREEMKRHNLAMEQFTRDREEYSRKRQQRFDYINKTLRQQKHAEQTFSDLDKAGRLYYQVTGNQLPPLKEPKFSDYYNPSKKQKDGELAFVAGGMGAIALGVLAYKFIKKDKRLD